MSIKVMSLVWEHGPQQQAQRFVLLALADFANDDGECWPSIEGIRRKVCMTDRGVQKIIRSLEADGWISTVLGTGRKGCNKYRIAAINPERGSPFQSAETPNDVPPERRSPRTTVHKTPNVVHHPPEPRSPEPSKNHHEPSVREDSAFDAFWAAYPRKEAKAAAKKAWTAALKRAPLEAILTGLRGYVDAVKDSERRFVAHPATWLNADRWNDEPVRLGPRRSTDDLRDLSNISATDDLARLMAPQRKAIG